MPDVYALENGILVSAYPLHARIHKEDLRDELKQRQAITNEPHCLLVKMRGIYVLGDDAKDFAACDEELKATLAVAVVFEPGTGYREFGKILVEDFVYQRRVKYPIRIFESESAALSWLREMLVEYA